MAFRAWLQRKWRMLRGRAPPSADTLRRLDGKPSGIGKQRASPTRPSLRRKLPVKSIQHRLPILLSQAIEHRVHVDCFVDHLADAVKVHDLREDLKLQVQHRRKDLAEQQSTILDNMCSVLNLLRHSADLRCTDRWREKLDITRHELKTKQDQNLAHQTELNCSIGECTSLLTRVLAQVFLSSEPFCGDVATGMRNSPMKFTGGFAGDLHFTEYAMIHLNNEEKRFRGLQQRFLDPSLATEDKAGHSKKIDQARRKLDALREEVADSQTRFLRHAQGILGEFARPIYRCSEENLRRLNSVGREIEASGWPTGQASQENTSDDLSRQSDRDSEGRPAHDRLDNADDDPLTIMATLAEVVRLARRQLQERQRALETLRDGYASRLSTHMMFFQQSNREEFDEAVWEGHPFEDQEQEALAVVKEAEEVLDQRQEALRQKISARQAPSESSFADHISDLQSGTAPLVCAELGQRYPYPALLRPWQRSVARHVYVDCKDEEHKLNPPTPPSSEANLNPYPNNAYEAGFEEDEKGRARFAKWRKRYEDMLREVREQSLAHWQSFQGPLAEVDEHS